MSKAILMILDGYGEGKKYEYNAVENAKTPTLKKLKQLSHSLLKTDGESVGLFKGDMGGSEVGHTTIGAGRIIPSILKTIQTEIENGDFKKNKNIQNLLTNLKKNNSNLHLIGLMSDKNVHSNIYHALEIVDISKSFAKNIFLHLITDGRDCGPHDSLKYIKLVQNKIKSISNCEIASIGGRAFGMDRENYIERTNIAFKSMFDDATGINSKDIEKYLKDQHQKGLNDQYIDCVHVNTKNDASISSKDCVLFFNFREDRVRQLAKKCEELKCKIYTMADVGGVKSTVIYPSEIVKHTLSEYLSECGIKQIKISETTKYAHVTYFLNGGREQPFENEDRIHVPTIETNDYAKTPKMQAKKIADAVCKAMKKDYDAIIVNFSNSDMLGHTGNYEATVKSLEFLDKCVKKILNTSKKFEYKVLITADHGNSEEMRTKNGEPHMAHTLNPVICVVADENYKMKKSGSLIDVAPTFLQLLGLKNNKYFKGESLIIADSEK